MSRRIAYLAYALVGLLGAASLGGCEDSSVGFINFYSYGVAEPGVTSVVLSIRSFEFIGSDSKPVDIDPNEPSDITVDLASGRNSILPGIALPAGDYTAVRLDIDPADSYVIASNGNRYALNVPSVYQSDGAFQVGKSVTASVVVDVDLRRALSSKLQDGVPVYTLKPISQVVTLETTGDIIGAVFPGVMIGSRSVTDPSCNPQVYVFPGANVTPEGYDVAVAGGTPPLTYATLLLHEPQDVYTYRASLLPPGHYTVALTCAADDKPGSASLPFTPSVTVKVSPQANAAAEFRGS